MEMEFKYKTGQDVKHVNGMVGVIVDQRVNQHGQPNYHVEYASQSLYQDEFELDHAHADNAVNKNIVEFDFSIDDMVKDDSIGIVGRIEYINMDSSGYKLYLVTSKDTSKWIKEKFLKKVKAILRVGLHLVS